VRILVATDGSPDAIRAAELAARLGQEFRQAEVVLVNVGHIPTLALGGTGPDGFVDLGALVEGLERAGQAILDRTAQAFARSSIPVTRVYRQGEPASEILKIADETRADLIIVGSRGLGLIGGLILGSVSERVLHGARRPVMVVR
jgi:nucleotide-binding universal stress UspA family protein